VFVGSTASVVKFVAKFYKKDNTESS
jgi:hypothetical protein